MKKNSVLVGNARRRKSILVRNDAKAKVTPVAETQTFTFNLLPKQARLEKLEDKEYTVVPMVILTEGVHNGSNGSLYYPPDELGKTPESWDHKPIVVYHPEVNGKGVSACSPDVINTRKVGLMMNTKWDRKNKRLKSEAWIDAARANTVDERVMEGINTNTVMEVSTGVNIDQELTEGEWNGEEYDAIARNYRPDHLAILPDQIGACSTKDGAGLLRNAAAGSITPKLHKKISALLRELGITSNAMSFDEIRTELNDALREKLNIPDNNVNGPYCWISDVYSNFVIYEYDGKTFRLGYSTSALGVTLDDAMPEEVEREIKYRKVAATANNRDQLQKETPMKLNKEQRKKHIDGLIANKESGWSEEDRPVLDAMKDNQLTALSEAHEEEPEKETPTTNATTTTQQQTDAKKLLVDSILTKNDYGWTESDRLALMTFNVDQLSKFKLTAPAAGATTNQQQPFDYNAWLKTAPAPVQEMVQNSVQVMNEEKAKLIAVIANHESKTFTEDQLKSKPLGELRALARLAAPVVDPNAPQSMPGYYGGMAPTANVTSNTEEALELPVMNFEAEDKTKAEK